MYVYVYIFMCVCEPKLAFPSLNPSFFHVTHKHINMSTPIHAQSNHPYQ